MQQTRLLSHDEARTVYDRIGSWVDWQAVFEDPATRDLGMHLDWCQVRSVLEFGCGTGRFAEYWLSHRLPPDASYLAVDISPRMHALAKRRLIRFGDRVQVHLTSGQLPLPFAENSFDRFVSNYVLDLLSVAEIQGVLREAYRLLRPCGLLGLVGLTNGFTVPSKAFERIWTSLHSYRPALVGGCRPMALTPLLPSSSWRVRHHGRISRFGVASEIVVAEKIESY
jgi:ubiquinone/menaquinone biosynthesis C-methylase UbiE